MSLWNEVTTVTEWNEIYGDNNKNPNLLIFKHSTQCPVSAEAFNQFNEFLKEIKEINANVILTKVIESRDVSNQIAQDTHVKHESPQVMLIVNNQVQWSATHWKITKDQLMKETKFLLEA